MPWSGLKKRADQSIGGDSDGARVFCEKFHKQRFQADNFSASTARNSVASSDEHD
jgi:hypothetical protein